MYVYLKSQNNIQNQILTKNRSYFYVDKIYMRIKFKVLKLNRKRIIITYKNRL